MTMSEEILGLLRRAGTHQTADELLKLADGEFLEGSFKTTLAAMALKSKVINRFDLRNIGKGFLYGLPEWPSPSAMPKPVVWKKPVDKVTKPAVETTQASGNEDPLSFNAFGGNCVPEKNRAELLPLIDAIDTGIYRIRGTNLLMQVNETGVDVYRIGE